MAVMTTTFTALAFNMTFLRDGILKRMRGTPVPPGAFFGGVVGNAVVNALVQIALLIGVGHLVFGGDLPRNWLTLAVFTVVGVATFACLGIAFAQLIPNFDAAPAYTNAVFLPAIFISGVFYSTEKMPRALEIIADVLPLKHVIDGLHAAIVTGSGIGSTLDALAIMLAWLAVGAVGDRARLPLGSRGPAPRPPAPGPLAGSAPVAPRPRPIAISARPGRPRHQRRRVWNASSAAADDGVPSTATSTEMPSTAPSWRKQAATALPVEKRCAGSSATAALDSETKVSPTPMPVTIIAGKMSAQ